MMGLARMLAVSAALVMAVAVVPQQAQASTLSYSINGGSQVAASGTPVQIGTLTVPVTVSLYDNNIAAGTTVTDDWDFGVSASQSYANLEGLEVNLNSGQAGGSIDSVELLNMAGEQVVTTGTAMDGGLFYTFTTPLAAGNYDLRVVASVPASSEGSYSGTLNFVAPVPLPASLGLMLAGLVACGLCLRRGEMLDAN